MRIQSFAGAALALLTATVLLGIVVSGADERITVEIDTVEVIARPITLRDMVTGYGGIITSVGRPQIEDLNAQDLPSALRRAPGVTISRYNLLGSYGGGEGGSVYIRGQGAGRPGSEIKVYVDGAPREVGVWSHPLMDVVPIDYASSIDVYKGPHPHSHPGTFGTVELRTIQRHNAGYETSLDLGAGEHNTYRGIVRHGGKVQAFDYYMGISHKESDGHRDHADGKLESQYLRLGLDAADEVHLSYILQRTDNWSRDPGRIDEPTPERDKYSTETLSHNLRLDHDAGRFNGYVVLYYEDGQIRWEKDNLSGPGTPAGNSDTDWSNYGFLATEDMTWGELTVTAGLEIEDEGGEFRNTTLSGTIPFQYEGRFTTVAPAVATRYGVNIGESTIIPSLGVRLYDHSRFSSKAAPHAGLICRTGEWAVFATYSRGVSYPGVYTVGVAASTIEELEAEILDHAEAGVHTGWGSRITLQTSVFYDKADNLLQYTPQGLVNVRDYETIGMELSTTLEPYQSVSLYGGVTHLDPKDEKTPRAPKFSATAGANWKPVMRLRLSADLEYVDEQYAFNSRSGAGALEGVEKLSSYSVANASIGFDISDWIPGRCELTLAVENLTDEVYEFHPGYPMPGRTLFVAVRPSF